jgi:hypothetical protein
MIHQQHQEPEQLLRQADPQSFFTDFSRSPVQLNSAGQYL